MAWAKKGRIFCADRNYDWMVSHAAVPTPLSIPNGRIRIYFATRNGAGQSLPTYLEVDATDPSQVLYLHSRPILELGEPGTFDDGGIMPSSVVIVDGRVYMYYTGWNPGVSVPYRNSIGLAISEDGGVSFQRAFKGPILDRTPHEPFMAIAPYVMRDGDVWHMWYSSGTGYFPVQGKLEPLYHIKYARSEDGILWCRDNLSCIHPLHEFEANVRPTVLKTSMGYRMWFCFRQNSDFRDGEGSYRIGYAESGDGTNWSRSDLDSGITVSESGWDAKMIAYPSVIAGLDKTYLFYNGNGFGREGLGYAEFAP